MNIHINLHSIQTKLPSTKSIHTFLICGAGLKFLTSPSFGFQLLLSETVVKMAEIVALRIPSCY